MNQYIITEGQLERLTAYRKRVLPFMCPDEREDWVKFMTDCESHPYNPQAEREKVLDRIENWCEVYFNTGYEGSLGELNDIKRYIKELREGKDGEQE